MENAMRAGAPRATATPAPGALGSPAASAATLAKGALRRLVMAQLEPTPENYARAYSEEAGQPGRSMPPPLVALVARLMGESLDSVGPGAQGKLLQAFNAGNWVEASHLMDELVPRSREARAAAASILWDQVLAGLDRDGPNSSYAERKEGLRQVLGSNCVDVGQLQTKVRQLVANWNGQRPVPDGERAAPAGQTSSAQALLEAAAESTSAKPATSPGGASDAASGHAVPRPADPDPVWTRLLSSLGAAAGHGLPSDDERCAGIAAEIASLTARIATEGPSEGAAAELESLCQRANKTLQHRHQMLEQLGTLCHELTAGMADLSEDASWARGQCDAMRLKLEEGLTPRGVRAVSGLLKVTRARQTELRQERETARSALRGLVTHMLHELDDLGAHTGRFQESVGRYAEVIEQADSLEGLADVVRDMAAESREVKALMTETQERLSTEHENASNLNARVSLLESELRRLSEEVSTDQLTQIANRRGLHMAFATEKLRAEGTGKALSLGLIDVDDFKKLNDKLGHSAGDEALKALAAAVRDGLRPADTVARYGGEEFVVMLPETDAEAAVAILTQLQRTLSRALFMHNEQQVFVTFSAGVSSYRPGEPLEDTLDRADEALYEAKRTGKNRTCIS